MNRYADNLLFSDAKLRKQSPRLNTRAHRKCNKNIIVILALSLKQSYTGLGSVTQVLDRWIIRKQYL